MRLYLSSYRIGDRAGALLALLGWGKRAAIIENGLDGVSPAARELFRTEVYDPTAELASLGIESSMLDLRQYFGNPEGLRAVLAGFDLVWVTGGNAFTLRRAMKQSGFDAVISELLDDDEIVYGGFSAGAVVAGPSLKGMELMDDIKEVPAGYDAEIAWDGLFLIDYAIVPRYGAGAAAEAVSGLLTARRVPFRALRDGEVVIWTGPRAVDIPALRRIA